MRSSVHQSSVFVFPPSKFSAVVGLHNVCSLLELQRWCIGVDARIRDRDGDKDVDVDVDVDVDRDRDRDRDKDRDRELGIGLVLGIGRGMWG